jgi:hypothetical protein
MIDPAKVCLYIPAELKKFKLDLFNRIGSKIEAAGGRTIRGDHLALDRLPDDIVPIVGAAPYLLPLVRGWKARGRMWCGWDRGYVRRVFATWLPRGEDGGYYRWTLNRYQMGSIRDVPDDRWKRLIPGNNVDGRKLEVLPWRKGGRHIVVALPSQTYSKSHDGADTWTDETLRQLALLTDRPIVTRDKECKRPLQVDLDGAHCLVTHGSVAAVESVICGCPVFVHPDSAAALVGKTDLKEIESPVYPDREQWLYSLSYSQFNERELVDGTLWRLIE